MAGDIVVFYVPKFARALNYTPVGKRYERFDERMHLLATLLALYPFTSNERLSDEFKYSTMYISQLASYYGVYKNKEHRQRVNKQNGDNPRSRRYYFWKKKQENETH